MSDSRPDDEGQAEHPDFDWQSPRWREEDESSSDAQADAERAHRFRDDVPPDQRGAIDQSGSVPAAEQTRPKKRNPKGA